jgi:hypothetical protein
MQDASKHVYRYKGYCVLGMRTRSSTVAVTTSLNTSEDSSQGLLGCDGL